MAEMIQNNFINGEISPSLYGRSDLQAYYHACAKATNFVVSREGSLKKRRGIVATAAVYHPFASCKLVPYLYDRDEAGVIVFYLSGSALYAELRSKTALGTSGTSALVYSSAMTNEQIKGIRCSQIGDTIFTNAKGLFNKKIVVTWANKTLTVSDYAQREKPSACTRIAIEKDGSWPDTKRTISYCAYVVRDSIHSEPISGSIKIGSTWTAGNTVTVTVTHGQSLETKDFDYIMIGKKSGAFYGELARFYPEEVTEETVVFVDENHTPGDVIYAQTNVLGDNFMPPLVTGAFQQRLVFANAQSNGSNLPMTLWFSAVGNLYNFYASRPASDEDPFSPTLMSTGPSFIRWLVPYQKMMVVMTDAGIFSITGSQNDGFAASTIHIDKLSNLSVSQTIQPIETEAGIVFVGADDKTLYTLSYDLKNDTTRPVNRMVMVKHITRKARFTSMALQTYPDQVIWCTLSDGKMASFTFERDEEVFAWSSHEATDMTVKEVVGTGSVTDSNTELTYGDVIFAVDNGSGSFLLGTFGNDWQDNKNGTTNNVVADLVTLPAESTQQTIAFKTKNVKDVLVRFFESGPIVVKPYDKGLAGRTLNDVATPTSGESRVVPMGYVSDDGQMHFQSTGNMNAEILEIVMKMEVA